MIELENFSIINFEKSNNEHLDVYNDFVSGESKSNMISLIGERLQLSHKTEMLEFGNAYLITQKDNIIGYLYLTNKSKNYIYMELSILKKYRKNNIGSIFLNEITDYIFYNNNDLKEIRLNIDKSNIGSMKAAMNAGYYYDEEDYMNQKIDFTRDNPYYLNKKR